MKLWIAWYGGLAAIMLAGAIFAAWPDSTAKPPDCSHLPNAEYLHCLGLADTVLPGCSFWGGESAGMKTLIYFGTGADVRITAVCVDL